MSDAASTEDASTEDVGAENVGAEDVGAEDVGTEDLPGAPPDVLVLNGPNLSRLGTREPEVYGHASHADLELLVDRTADELGLRARVRQSDDESDLVRWLHEAVDTRADVVINPAAFTHYSYALRDAAALVTGAGLVLIEVHLSNPGARESFRRHSVVTPVATGVVAGLGLPGYALALRAVAERRHPPIG